MGTSVALNTYIVIHINTAYLRGYILNTHKGILLTGKSRNYAFAINKAVKLEINNRNAHPELADCLMFAGYCQIRLARKPRKLEEL